MKLALIGAALFAACLLTGCASVNSGITSLANTIDSPAVQQASGTIKTVSTALVCDVAKGSALALAVEAQAKAHTGITNTIDVASTAVCSALQGKVVSGKTEKNVPAVTAVTAAP